jgi:hypothetical protein
MNNENKSEIIILKKKEIAQQKVYYIYNGEFDPILIKIFYESLDEKESENRKTFKKYFIEKDYNDDIYKVLPQDLLFNKLEYYFTFFSETKIDFFKLPEEEDLNKVPESNIEKMLQIYYKYVLKIYKNRKDISKKETEKILQSAKKDFTSEIKRIGELENDQNKLIADYLCLNACLFEMKYNFKDYPKNDFEFQLQIFDENIKNCNFNQQREILWDSFNQYKNKKYKENEDYYFFLRLYYLDKLLLEEKESNQMNVKESIENIKTDNPQKYEKLLPYLKIYNLSEDNVGDNYEKIRKKLMDPNNLKKEFMNNIKRIDLNNLIENNKISKQIILLCLYAFQNIIYPLESIIGYLVIIYDGLISENLFNENKIVLKDSDLQKELIEINDNDFKKSVFDSLIQYLYEKFDSYKIVKIKKIPLFQLLIVNMFLWRINLAKNNDEILSFFNIFKIMEIKLSFDFKAVKLFKSYILIYEIIGDIYLKHKYYRQAKRIYNSAIRKIIENETEKKYERVFLNLKQKKAICKYYCGYNIEIIREIKINN